MVHRSYLGSNPPPSQLGFGALPLSYTPSTPLVSVMTITMIMAVIIMDDDEDNDNDHDGSGDNGDDDSCEHDGRDDDDDEAVKEAIRKRRKKCGYFTSKYRGSSAGSPSDDGWPAVITKTRFYKAP